MGSPPWHESDVYYEELATMAIMTLADPNELVYTNRSENVALKGSSNSVSSIPSTSSKQLN